MIRRLLFHILHIAMLSVPLAVYGQAVGTPDYGVWNNSGGCLTPNDTTYKLKLEQLARSLFGLSTLSANGVGCVTEPYLADDYFRVAPQFNLKYHAGIDFRAPSGTLAYAI